MWFSPAEREPRLASSRPPGGLLRGRTARVGGTERMRARAAASLPPPGRSQSGEPRASPPARPGHRQFTARGPRLPAAVTITICKALPAVAHRADPTASGSGQAAVRLSEFMARGPQGADTEGPWGPGLAGLPATSSQGSPTPRGACDGGAPVPAPTDPHRPGAHGGVEPLPPQSCQGFHARALCPPGSRVVPVPAAASPGPAPLLHFLRCRPP